MANPSKSIIVSLVFLFIALSIFAKADMALPPTIVNVKYNGVAVNGNFSAAMLTCSNNTNYTMQSITPQLNVSIYDTEKKCYWNYNDGDEAYCKNGVCEFYFFPSKDLRMVFYLPDVNRTFVTNEVSINNGTVFNYDAGLYSNGTALLIVGASVPNSPIPPNGEIVIAVAVVLTIIIEVIISFAYLSVVKIKKKKDILIAVAVANVISVLAIWLVFIYFFGVIGFVAGEVFAILFDGYVTYRFNKKTITLKRSMIMSLIMNIVSLVIGLLILLSLAAFFII
jgi:hypothetical protein